MKKPGVIYINKDSAWRLRKLSTNYKRVIEYAYGLCMPIELCLPVRAKFSISSEIVEDLYK